MMSYSPMYKRYFSPYGREANNRRTARYRRTTGRHGYTSQKYKAQLYRPGFDRQIGFYRSRLATPELKFKDEDADEALISNNGNIHNLMLGLLGEGTGPSARIGRKITIRAIEWKWNLSLPELIDGDDAIDPDSARLIVYQDKQCNGTAATVTDILTTDSIASFPNMTNEGRFILLYDKLVNMNYGGLASATTGTVSQAMVVRAGTWSKKSCFIPIEYSGAQGSLNQVRSNNIGILLISKNGRMGITSTMRTRYSDA